MYRKNCPICGMPILDEDGVCPNCGKISLALDPDNFNSNEEPPSEDSVSSSVRNKKGSFELGILIIAVPIIVVGIILLMIL